MTTGQDYRFREEAVFCIPALSNRAARRRDACPTFAPRAAVGKTLEPPGTGRTWAHCGRDAGEGKATRRKASRFQT